MPLKQDLAMSGHSHNHYAASKGKNYFILALVFTLAFAFVEAITGWLFGSLTLMGDAGHMASDTFSLALAGIAAWIACKPPSKSHTYGFGRAEIIAAWCSSLLLLAVVIGIVIEAISRLRNPHPVAGGAVMIVAILGLIVNIFVAWILSKGEKTLNTRAAILHVIGDMLGSIAVLVSGAIIYFTHWNLIDPILSLFICALILISTIRLMKESLQILMEGTPKHISLTKVKQTLLNVAEIRSVHDLHIWTLTSGTVLLTAHVQIDNLKQWNRIRNKLCGLLADKYHIEHATIQPETNPKHCKLFREKSI